MRFRPPFCPDPGCPSHPEGSFRYRHRGSYTRRCDRRRVPRFQCLHCHRRFSSQSFRLDHGLRKPWLDAPVARLLAAKVTLRRAAELLGVQRRTVERRLDRFGPHCEALHRGFLRHHEETAGGLAGAVALDELETFERDRHLFPITVPILVSIDTWFVIHADVAPLPARGNMPVHKRSKLEAWEALHGRRRCGSRSAVQRTLEAWRGSQDPACPPVLVSDRKSTYRSLFREVFDGNGQHTTVSSRAPRTPANPLFAINNTNAGVRDHLSRLVRRSWAHSKRIGRLRRHLWVWVAFRNYIRPITRRCRDQSAATALRICGRMWSWTELLRWRADAFFALAR